LIAPRSLLSYLVLNLKPFRFAIPYLGALIGLTLLYFGNLGAFDLSKLLPKFISFEDRFISRVRLEDLFLEDEKKDFLPFFWFSGSKV